MFNTLINNWNDTKSYATQERLEKALKDAGLDSQSPLMVVVPTGKNKGRFTAVFPARGGDNIFIIHLGFKVIG